MVFKRTEKHLLRLIDIGLNTVCVRARACVYVCVYVCSHLIFILFFLINLEYDIHC